MNKPISFPDIQKISETDCVQRFDVINALIRSRFESNCNYLEIGICNPDLCYNKIIAQTKKSVDPCLEYSKFQPDFKMTSDEFFLRLKNGETNLSKDFKWDIIFIDGLHLAEQVERDITNSLLHTSDNGLIVLHDCNPPSWLRTHSDHKYFLENVKPWNGTVWKAFYRMKTILPYKMYTVDTDYGVGVIDKSIQAEPISHENPYFEFSIFKSNVEKHLGLIDIDTFVEMVGKQNCEEIVSFMKKKVFSYNTL
jgi:hypothetical protein